MGGILGIVILIADIWAILDIIKSSKTGVQKALWVILVLVLPLVGLIAYLIAGRKSA